MIGTHTIKTWSKTQALIARSSAEAELYSAVKASSEALGCQTLSMEFGHERRARVFIDSTAAKSICERQGLDKVRHVDVGVLWLQEIEARKNLPLLKILGTDNPADLFTKHLSKDTVDKYLQKLSIHFAIGRAVNAPEVYSLNTLSKSKPRDAWNENNGFIMRMHYKPRLSLFAPMDVAGYPNSDRTIGRIRVTKGLTITGQKFEMRDDWTMPSKAHRNLAIPWIGTTSFTEMR